MPRAYGITNAAPYASAPAVGAAGDTYWNTTEKSQYVSDGTAWVSTVGAAKITQAQLAPGVTVAGYADGFLTGQAAATTLTTVMTAALNGFRGGSALVLVNIWGVTAGGGTTASQLQLQLLVDTTVVVDRLLDATGGYPGQPPYGIAFSAVASLTAGNHTLTVKAARASGTMTWWLGSGALQVIGWA